MKFNEYKNIKKLQLFLVIIIALGLIPSLCYAACMDKASSQEEINDKIIREIEARYKGAVDIKLTYNNEIITKSEICITNLAIDNYSNTFRVNFKIDGKNYLYQGKFTFNYLIPALQTTLTTDNVIKNSDIYFISYPAIKINNNIAKTKEELIGKAVKNTINADRPINIRDVYNPILIHKNENINIIYEKNNLSIKMTALALENGSMNDMIKVKNTRSGSIFTAKVTDEKTAVIN